LEYVTPTCLRCDHICGCKDYWSILGRVGIYIENMFLVCRRLLELVGSEIFSPTRFFLEWNEVEIFNQLDIFHDQGSFVYLRTMFVVFICVKLHLLNRELNILVDVCK
jgi:hypothetical protein